MNKITIFFPIVIALSLISSCATNTQSEMNSLLETMNSISENSECARHDECGSLTLGWSKCAIDNLEFPINGTRKDELRIMLETAESYEKLWKNSVELGEIQPNCQPQKFSKTSCENNRCVLAGPQIQPETPPPTIPNFTEKLLNE